MSKAEILEELPKLSPAERREIRARLYELDPAADDWDDDGELTDEEKHLIEARLAEHERNPETAIPWEEFDARLKARFGQ